MTDIVSALQEKPNFWSILGVFDEQMEQALNLHFAQEYREYLDAFGMAVFYGHN